MSAVFKEFPKIARFNRETIITEKIDGTNASVWVVDEADELFKNRLAEALVPVGSDLPNRVGLLAGSRARFVTPGKTDNFGFAAWVKGHAQDLAQLGRGAHYGEWWGKGIQRGYGLDERRFSLFNVSRWNDDAQRPACCHVVPELWRGHAADGAEGVLVGIQKTLTLFEERGSIAAQGFMNPEGIVIYHTASGALYKYTLGGDGHKGATR